MKRDETNSLSKLSLNYELVNPVLQMSARSAQGGARAAVCLHFVYELSNGQILARSR